MLTKMILTAGSEKMKINCRQFSKNTILAIQNEIGRFDSRILQFIVRSYLKTESNLRLTEKSYARNLLSRALPLDPLDGEQLPYTLAMYCSPKDISVLPYSLSAAVENLEIREVILMVAPEKLRPSIGIISRALGIEGRVRLVTDEELLEKYFGNITNVLHGASKMQMLKIASIFEIDDNFAMLLDSDTVILKKRKWLTPGGICVQISQEYMHRHQNFINKNFPQLKSEGLGFVTHHQVTPVSEIKSELIPRHRLQPLALEMQKAFNDAPNWRDYYPSEWQIFGQFMRNKKNLNANIVQFSNSGMPQSHIEHPEELIKESIEREVFRLKKNFPDVNSVSFHSYK